MRTYWPRRRYPSMAYKAARWYHALLGAFCALLFVYLAMVVIFVVAS